MMKTIRYSLFVATSLWSGTVLAQTTNDPQSGLSASEIVVTANRREERLQDVPLTIAAVSGEELAAAGVKDTQSLEQVVPGLVMGQAATLVQPTIRGIGTRGSTPGEESNVAMYLDGVYQPAMSSNNFQLLNVERVEVLKGPQGTLYGRNATGGAINVVTSKPGDEMTAKFVLSYGRFNQVDAAAYAAVPLVADVISADVAYKRFTRDGYVDDLIRGGKIGKRKDSLVRARLRFRPTDAIDIIAAFSHTTVKDPNNFALQPVFGNTVGRAKIPDVLLPTHAREYAGDRLPESGFKQTDYSLTADVDLGFALLQSVSDYQENSSNFRSDSDGTIYNAGGVFTDDNYVDAFSQEVRLISQGTGRFQWIVGAMYFDSKQQLDPLIIDTATFSGIIRNSGQKSKAYAGYAEGTLEFIDRLFVTAGLRYSWEKRTLFIPPTATRPDQLETSATFDDWTPRASIRYEISPRTNIYFTYAQGFKSGLFNGIATNIDNVPGGGGVPVNPEKITSYEAGIKFQPMPWLRSNLSAFIYDYTDLQVQARREGSDVAFLQNAGTARVKGIDLDISASPYPGLSVNLTGEYLDAEFKKFPGAALLVPKPEGGNASIIDDASGTRMLRAPKWTFTAGFNYEFDAVGGVIKLGANANYNDGYLLQIAHPITQPSYWMVNASVGWWTSDDRFGVTLWGENLADEDVAQYALVSGNETGFSYRPPTMYGIRLNGKF